MRYISYLPLLYLLFTLPLLFVSNSTLAQEGAIAAQSPNESAIVKYVNIGVLAYRPKPQVKALWQPMIDYLNQTLQDTIFTIIPYTNSELDRAVAQNDVDFVFVQPSHYIRLTYEYGLSSPLATLITLQNSQAVDLFGGVIFVSSDRDDINSLDQLRGKVIASPDINGLGGYQMQIYEMQLSGVQQREFSVIFTGQPQDRVVDAVLAGKADAGFIRTGVIESLVDAGRLRRDSIKVLNVNYSRPDFPFIASTRYYPEWPFAALNHVDHKLAHRVASALLTLPHGGELAKKMSIYGFTIPGDYRNIDELLRSLRMPPFDKVPDFTILDIWHNWKGVISLILLAIAALLITLVIYLIHRNQNLIKTQDELRKSLDENIKLRLAVDQSPESIVICDTDANIIYANNSFIIHSGHSANSLIGQQASSFCITEFDPELHPEIWQTLRQGESWQGEISNQYEDGSVHIEDAIITPVRDSEWKTIAYVTIKQDITARKQIENHVHQLAFYDPLTSLGNRALLQEEITQRLNSNDLNPPHLLILINIDRFKLINEVHGHRFGDELLISFSRRIQALLPLDSNSMAARISADEFAVIITCQPNDGEDNQQAILALARCIGDTVAEPFSINAKSITISISLGLTTFPEAEDKQPLEVIQRAVTALNFARKSGGNQSVLYDPKMHKEIADRFFLESELRNAVRHHQLMLYLQPQYNQYGHLHGAEVLLRWNHPQRGMVPPSIFIPLAEESDLIIELSEYLFVEAIAILKRLQDNGKKIHLSINVSPRHCYQNNLVDWLGDLIQRSGVDATWLTLEITEGLFIKNIAEVTRRMEALTRIGIKFSIDDFGTGYSSLTYLKQLPIHEIKIDKSFIQEAYTNSSDAVLVEAILAVADHMSLSVVAEGVETKEQSDYLKQHGKVIEQGYLHGKPLPAEQWVSSWIEENQS
jgi:diguanylate cyclase (GGDEF)-like protein/PAS domain S-box-containing protein